MRDIRKDLQERIAQAETRKGILQREVKRMDEKMASLKSLLEQEETEWRARQPSLLDLGSNISPIKTHSELSRFLLSTLGDGGFHRTDELAGLAQKQSIPINGKSYKRAVHFSLVGMKNNKLVDMVDHGIWQIHKNGANVAGRRDDLQASSPPTHPA